MAEADPQLSRTTAGAAPPRPPGSVRRTTTIDATWPDGPDGDLQMDARARDAITPAEGGPPIVAAQACLTIRLKPDRTITAIQADPPHPGLHALVGARGGGGLRKAIRAAIPDEAAAGSLIHLLLDDLAGTSLVVGWAWSQWDPGWLAARMAASGIDVEAMRRAQVNICVGMAEGASSQTHGPQSMGTTVPDLRNPADPFGWHEYEAQTGMAMRRARRIDLWREGDRILIDSAFQDSASTPNHRRAAVHEYRLTATADEATMTLATADADPRILPYVECPNARFGLARLVGTPMRDLRTRVLDELRGTAGCTHLNDAMRALADVPVLTPLIP